MSQPDPRQSILIAAQRNDSYSCLQQAICWLANNPDDHEVRLTAIGQFARIGLYGPAVELADEAPGLAAASPELGPAIAGLRAQPSGIIPANRMQDRFERNFRAAAESRPGLADHEASLRGSLAELDVFGCNDGNLLLSRKRDGHVREWLPAILHWESALSRVRVLPETTVTVVAPYAIEGVALGHLARTIFDGTKKMLVDFTPRIHLFEPNLAQLAAWLSVGDQRDLLRSERVHLWFGPDGPARFEQFCETHAGEIHPKQVIRQPGWGPAAQAVVAPSIERAERTAARRFRRHQDAVGTMLASRSDPAYYADRFTQRHDRALRILGVTSRHTTFLQYSMRDIADAAAALGHEFRMMIEESAHSPAVPRDRILAMIAEFEPDLILIIDHNRCEYDSLYDFQIPFCNWIQDDLPNLFGPGRGSHLHPYDVVVGTIGSWRARQSGYPDDQWMHVRTPVSLTKFSNEPLPASELRKYVCDLSFVSNLSISAAQFLEQHRQSAPTPEVRALIEALFDELGPRIAAGRAPGSPVQTNAITVEVARSVGLALDMPQADQLRQNFTDRLINIFFRHQVLVWASELGLDLHLYGRGWEQHPELGTYAKGVADHGRELRAVFQASRLNLQSYPYTATHQRLCEGLAAGGAFVIRRTPLDMLSPLMQRIEQRAIALDIESDDELRRIDDEQLRRDLAELNERLYAPGNLYDGFAADLRISANRPCRMEAGALLPDYERVSFSTREEFAAVVARMLADEQDRRTIAAAQREAIVEHLSYKTALENVLAFLERRFTRLSNRIPASVA